MAIWDAAGPDGQHLIVQGRLGHLRLTLLVEHGLPVLVGLRHLVWVGWTTVTFA